MTDRLSPDRLNQALRLFFALLGAFLAIVGWYRWFGSAS
jgi:hypothetical protein